MQSLVQNCLQTRGLVVTTAAARTHPDWNHLHFGDTGGRDKWGPVLTAERISGVCTACGRLQFPGSLTEGDTLYSGGFREEQTVTSPLWSRGLGADIFLCPDPHKRHEELPENKSYQRTKAQKTVSTEPSALKGSRTIQCK